MGVRQVPGDLTRGQRGLVECRNLTFGNVRWRRDKKTNKVVWLALVTKGKNSKRKGSREIVLGDRAVRAVYSEVEVGRGRIKAKTV